MCNVESGGIYQSNIYSDPLCHIRKNYTLFRGKKNGRIQLSVPETPNIGYIIMPIINSIFIKMDSVP